ELINSSYMNLSPIYCGYSQQKK
ncbi:pentachlorophenol 4-monooxygenase domain protein, partial [Chlamydia psittaci 06-1683]